MQAQLNYGHQDRLMGVVVDGANWITNGHWAAREKYVVLQQAELRLSIESKGNWTIRGGKLLPAASLKKVILQTPPEKRANAILTPVQFALDSVMDLSFIRLEDAESDGAGRAINTEYVCEPFSMMDVMVDPNEPSAPVMFMDGEDKIQAVVMPMRIESDMVDEIVAVGRSMQNFLTKWDSVENEREAESDRQAEQEAKAEAE